MRYPQGCCIGRAASAINIYIGLGRSTVYAYISTALVNRGVIYRICARKLGQVACRAASANALRLCPKHKRH
ncbi:MAG TPA: hypothetical protein PLM55_00010 [Chitinophagales bacterium]|nr:hypothetical protein [Chitinophagales bacterium]